MSIIDAAFKQSQTANNTEQAHLAYQQTKQLAFYRKLSIGLAGVGLSATFALAGFYSGQYIQSQSQSTSVQAQRDQAEEILQVTTQLEAKHQEGTELSKPLEEKPIAMAQNKQDELQIQEQYQWMSVQVGIDEQGAPIFKQQLVPLSAVANVNNTPAASSFVSNSALPEQQKEDLSQYRVLGKPLGDDATPNNQAKTASQIASSQDDLSQYRVLGKPLDDDATLNDQVGITSQIARSQDDLSQYRVLGKPLASEPEIQVETSDTKATASNTDNQASENNNGALTDEAAARLKAAFELAVAETADKDFSQQEAVEAAPEKERLSIEFLPEKTQAAIGKLTYQAHIYATSEHKRWIKINGVELYEGDKINGMRLLEIAPEASIFRFQGYDFTVKAMQDWQPY
jgi:general secretion pathway protein B